MRLQSTGHRAVVGAAVTTTADRLARHALRDAAGGGHPHGRLRAGRRAHARDRAARSRPSIITAVPLTTEEEGIGYLAGAWLGGLRGVLLMQSSGVGNCINTLALAAQAASRCSCS